MANKSKKVNNNKINNNAKKIDNNDKKLDSKNKKIDNNDKKLDSKDKKIDSKDVQLDNKDTSIDYKDEKVNNTVKDIDNNDKKINNQQNIDSKFKVIAVATCVIFGVIFLLTFINGKNNTEASANKNGEIIEIGLTEYRKLLNGSDKAIIYIARPTCSYCQKYKPVVEEFVKESGYVFNYLNTDELSDDELKEIYGTLSYFEENGFSTPAVLVVQDGKEIDSLVGATDIDSLRTFIKNAVGDYTPNTNSSDKNVDDETSANVLDGSSFSTIDVNKYLELYNASDESLVYVASSTCSNCIIYTPVLSEVTDENNLDVNFIELTALSQDDISTLYENNSQMQIDETIYTPALYVVSSGKVVAHLTGSVSKDKTVEFLKENGFIK